MLKNRLKRRELVGGGGGGGGGAGYLLVKVLSFCARLALDIWILFKGFMLSWIENKQI